jgi:serine O-acetyltransferase
MKSTSPEQRTLPPIMPHQIKENEQLWSTFVGLQYLMASDLYRFAGSTSMKAFIKCFLIEKGFNFSVYYRIAHYLYRKRGNRKGFFWLLSQLFNVYYRQVQIKYSVDISSRCALGPGIAFLHLFGIVIYPGATLGKNINISHFVTIGMKDTGKYAGAPTIGNNVYIGPGAKIIGKIHVGNHVTIGANAVVTKDVPEFAVVGGVPAKTLSLAPQQEHVHYPI